ncbi:ECF RNA polymerase sigma factor SigW [compost metagenome]
MRTDEKFNDEELKALLAKGDTVAFKIIFDKYYSQLVYFATKFTGNVEQAEDIVMDVFSKFWDKRVNSTTISNLSSFLFTSTKNACIDYLRKEARLPVIFQNLDVEVADYGAIIEGEEAFARLLQQVLDNIESLPNQCKIIFKLIYLQGKTTKDVAELLDLSVQSVRNQKARGLNLLKERIKPHHLLPLILMQIAVFQK